MGTRLLDGSTRPTRHTFLIAAVCCLIGSELATAADIWERVEEDPDAALIYEASYALVIGIDDYTNGWPRLHNAEKDARKVATALEALGFEVDLRINLSSNDFQSTVKEFFVQRGRASDSRLLLWYAGHGHTIQGEGFLVPADAPPGGDPNFKLKALHMRDFGSYARLAEAKHVLSIFDSCFSGTVFDSRRSSPPASISYATSFPVRQFISSGDAEQTVMDDGSFRKVFIGAIQGDELADANRDGYLTASELGLFLSDRVTNLTLANQTPRYGKLRDPDWDRGDFVLTTPRAGEQASGKVSVPYAPADSSEVATRNQAQANNDAASERNVERPDAQPRRRTSLEKSYTELIEDARRRQRGGFSDPCRDECDH